MTLPLEKSSEVQASKAATADRYDLLTALLEIS